MLKITFALDQENDGIEIRHDGRQVFWDNAPDGWTSYFQVMPCGVPVLLDYDNGDPREPDDRDYPQGEGTDSRLKRWLVDNGTDPRIREIEYDEDDQPLTAAEDVTMSGADLHSLLLQVAERMYWYGADDVVERHGIR
jgi:hypothetical protein